MVQTIQREFRSGRVKTGTDLAKSIGSRRLLECRRDVSAACTCRGSMRIRRKRAEEALRSNQNFRLIVDSIPGFVVTTTPTGEIELVNRRMLEYFGKTVEEISNWRTSDIVHPDHVVETIAAWTRSIQTGEVYEFENRLRRADGAYRWFHARGLALRDKEGRIVRWYYLLTDVDDRKQAEDKLRRSEAYLANAQSLTQTGTWAINPSNLDVSYWSREIYRIYGLDPDKDQPSLSTALERIDPDDRPGVDRIFKEAIRQKTGLDVQFRVVTPDGTRKHIHTVARPVVDEAGNIVEMVGTTMDVTEQWTARTELEKAFEEIKQRTEAVRRSEGELRDVINAVPARIWRTSPEGQ